MFQLNKKKNKGVRVEYKNLVAKGREIEKKVSILYTGIVRNDPAARSGINENRTRVSFRVCVLTFSLIVPRSRSTMTDKLVLNPVQGRR